MGINPADAASHQAFIASLNLPFDLLVDEERQIATAYGTVKPDGSGIQRHVIVVGKNGRVILREPGAPDPEDILAAMEAAEDET